MSQTHGGNAAKPTSSSEEVVAGSRVVADDWESAGDDQLVAQIAAKQKQLAEQKKLQAEEERARERQQQSTEKQRSQQQQLLQQGSAGQAVVVQQQNSQISLPQQAQAPQPPQQQQQQQFRLLRRPKTDQNSKRGNGASGDGTVDDEEARKMSMTYEQREAAYQQARDRIFGKTASSSAVPTSATILGSAAALPAKGVDQTSVVDESQEIDAMLNETHITSTGAGNDDYNDDEEKEEGGEDENGLGKPRPEIHDHLSDVPMVTQENAPLKHRRGHGGGSGIGGKISWSRVAVAGPPEHYLQQLQFQQQQQQQLQYQQGAMPAMSYERYSMTSGGTYAQPVYPSHQQQHQQTQHWSSAGYGGIYSGQGVPLYPAPYSSGGVGGMEYPLPEGQPGWLGNTPRVGWGQPPPHYPAPSSEVPHYSTLPMAPPSVGREAPKPLADICIHPPPVQSLSQQQRPPPPASSSGKSYSSVLAAASPFPSSTASQANSAPYGVDGAQGFSRPPAMLATGKAIPRQQHQQQQQLTMNRVVESGAAATFATKNSSNQEVGSE